MIQIFDTKARSVRKNKNIQFLHKLLCVAVFIDDLKVVKLLVDVFCLNPFWRILDGSSALHVAVLKGKDSIVRFFLAQHYVLRGDQSMKRINISKMVNKAEKVEYNTPLHLAVLKGRKSLVEDLIAAGAKFSNTNFMEWNAFDMTKAKHFKKLFRKIIKREERLELIQEAKFFEPDVVPEGLFGKFLNIFEFQSSANIF